MLQKSLKSRAEELVEGDKLTDLHVCRLLCDGERDVDKRTLTTLCLFIDIVHVDERVEHTGDKVELIRHEWIIVGKILGILIRVVGSRQNELSLKLVLVFLIQVLKHDFHIAFLLKDTLLCDEFWIGTLQGGTNLKTAHNLAVVITGLVDVAAFNDLRKVLLGCAGKPYLRVAFLEAFLDNFLEL